MVRVEENTHDYHITAEVSNPPGACVGCGSERLIGHGLPGQGMEGLARMMVGAPGKKAETHETAGPAKNYGAGTTTLTELIESGKL